MSWEDLLGVAVTLGLLWFLFRALLKAERV